MGKNTKKSAAGTDQSTQPGALASGADQASVGQAGLTGDPSAPSAPTGQQDSPDETGAATGQQVGDGTAITLAIGAGGGNQAGSDGAEGTDGQPGANGGVSGLQPVAGDPGAALSGAPSATSPTGIIQEESTGAAQLAAGQDGAADTSQSVKVHDFLADIVYGFEISAVRDGFRRAGRAWMREPVFITEEDITKEQFDLLAAEPNIRIMPARRSASELVESSQ